MTPTQRITELESAAFRTDRRFDEAAEQSQLIRGAVNELSVEVRELRHDLSEIRTVQTQQSEALRELLRVQADQSEALREIRVALGTLAPKSAASNGE